MTSAHRTTVSIASSDLHGLCRKALHAAGADAESVEALTAATIAAERRGHSEVGATHLLDYVSALRAGGLNGKPRPAISAPRLAVTLVDADRGAMQRAFDLVLPDVIDRARQVGIAAVSVHNAFSAGALSYYTEQLAERGLLALAASNARPLMSALGSTSPILGTNPLSFAVPHPDGPRLFDQASSVTAWVNVRDAAQTGAAIPRGWAIDAGGEPTEDAHAALAGALLPFGGAKGANIAFMVELLATLSGASAPPQASASPDSETASPSLGLFVVAIDPAAFDPGYVDRTEGCLSNLAHQHGADFGRRKPARDVFEVPTAVIAELRAAAESTGPFAPAPGEAAA